MANNKYKPKNKACGPAMNKTGRQGNRNKSWEERESKDMRRDTKRATAKDDGLYGLNDFSWYNQYPELTEAAGRLPFPYRPGRVINIPVRLKDNSGGGEPPTKLGLGIPGTMVLHWAPSFGNSQDVTSPLSISAKELYAQVRSKFSGSLEADAPDFLVYLGALDSIFSAIGWAKRLYRVLDTYSSQNQAVPGSVLHAMGISEDVATTLRSNKAQMWFGINELIHMTEKFQMPAVMDLFRRHYWMNENIYTDAKSINSQFYIFNQVWFYKFAMLNTPSNVRAGGLQMVAAPWAPDATETLTWSAIYNFIKSLIDALASSDDAYTISGYLLRAFEGTENYNTTLLENFSVQNPVYVPEVLAQIENSECVCQTTPKLSDFADLNVTQDPTTNTLLSKVCVKTSSLKLQNQYSEGCTLSIRNDAPTVEDVFIATRLKATYALPASTSTPAQLDIICGTELPLLWQCVVPGIPNDSGVDPDRWDKIDMPTHRVWLFNNDAPMNGNDVGKFVKAVTYKSQFDWSPITTVMWSDKMFDGKVRFASDYLVLGDIHNLTPVSEDVMSQIHVVALYSELNAFRV